MIAVFVTLRYGEAFSTARLRRVAEEARARFEGMPGLISKVFCLVPERREGRNVYVWDSLELARTFFTPETRARIAALYGVEPVIEYAKVGALVDNSHA